MNVKRLLVTTVIAGALVGLAVPAVLAQGPVNDSSVAGTGYRRGATASIQGSAGSLWSPGSQAGTVALGDLDQAEIDGLLYMREEEKLAHDVYTALYQEWGLDEFQTIATSEQRHADTVLRQLERYGIDDPSAGLAAGEFQNAELQALYDELIARGSESLEAALRVGAAIEEIDILDLQEEMAETENAALLRVYTNLSQGSQNHLRSFVSLLQSEVGVSYTPEYLDEDAYQAILLGSNEQGRGSTAAGNGTGTAACDGTGSAEGTMTRQGGRW